MPHFNNSTPLVKKGKFSLAYTNGRFKLMAEVGVEEARELAKKIGVILAALVGTAGILTSTFNYWKIHLERLPSIPSTQIHQELNNSSDY